MRPLFIACLILVTSSVAAQDSVFTSRRNTIKLDITSHWLYRNAVVLNYERVINNKRTWSVMAGYQQLPQLHSFGTNIAVTRDTREAGFKFGGEYRFYLARENKYPAPRGVYLGPYFTYLNFANEQAIVVDVSGTTETANLNTRLSVANLGVQLGYQFVFNDRWTFDISFLGPSFSYYHAEVGLDGSYTFNPDDISNEILKELINRFPALGDLLGGSSVVSQGKADKWAYGFRYQLQVGYRFGKNNK